MNEPWRIPDRRPKPGYYRLGPEFPGCMNTGTRPVLYNLPSKRLPHSGQRYIVCHECDYESVALVVMSGGAAGSRILKKSKRNRWHGDAQVFKTRKSAVAAFHAWCERLQTEYDAMRAEARRLRDVVKTNPASPEGVEAALKLGDMGVI